MSAAAQSVRLSSRNSETVRLRIAHQPRGLTSVGVPGPVRSRRGGFHRGSGGGVPRRFSRQQEASDREGNRTPSRRLRTFFGQAVGTRFQLRCLGLRTPLHVRLGCKLLDGVPEFLARRLDVVTNLVRRRSGAEVCLPLASLTLAPTSLRCRSKAGSTWCLDLPPPVQTTCRRPTPIHRRSHSTAHGPRGRR